MPVAKAVVLANAVPPVAALYHLIPVPVATKLATVEPLQNVCADAVGAAEHVVPEITIFLFLYRLFEPSDSQA